MTFIDVLFTIIFKGKYVYWIDYGPGFETAKNSDFQRRKVYAYKYLKIFLAASVIMICLFGSMLLDLSGRPACLRKWKTAAYGVNPDVAVDFCIILHPKDFRFLRYCVISSSLTVSKTCCSSLTKKSRSFGR